MCARQVLLSVVLVAATPIVSLAEGDVFLELVGNQLRTGFISEDGATLTPNTRVFFAEFETLSGVTFAAEPGVQSLPSGLGSATSFRFDFTKALRVWNGSDFSSIALSTLTADLGPLSVTSPASDAFTPGFAIALDPSGSHEHPDWTLNAPAARGVYLLEVQWSLNTGQTSLPTWMLWSNNADAATADQAFAWATANIPAPTTAALMGGFAAITLRRRRSAAFGL